MDKRSLINRLIYLLIANGEELTEEQLKQIEETLDKKNEHPHIQGK